MKFINVGFGNLVSSARIVSVATPDSSPIRRLIQDSRDAGNVIDVSCGKKTQSVIITDSKLIILSCLSTEALQAKLNDKNDDNTQDTE